ncbi:cation:proton antiporter [Adhaeribacter soli]|uniref:Sodium:proton antiporter n=1 Tax=Adhaeribacter soli TaxID=2607655 RepID=A0A5N1J7X8_9BACT|nr:cation:proton antiporter [Adhaeribacter soli]KAA9340771.1 sodium:proton antiporter [Adhaeribacter soli]
MNPYSILIFLSVLVIISYGFDLLSKKTKIPSVLMLLACGIGLQYVAAHFGFSFVLPRVVLELFGIIGLILIVLEGSLDLELSREKIPIIRKSFLAGLLILVLSAVSIAFIIQFTHNVPFQQCLINATPLAVISSAIAIPSVTNLSKEKKEFIVYESTFSDILGIMLFNFAIQDNFAQSISIVTFLWDLILIVVVSIVSCTVLIFFINQITHHTKFFLILAVLILIYSTSKIFHLSPLLLVMAFGIILNNTDLIVKRRLKGFIRTEKLKEEVNQLKIITAESAFLIRTFFFLIFGFSFELHKLLDTQLLFIGSLIVTTLTLIRLFYLRFISRTSLFPELFIAPKGLITILLYYSIPAKFLIPNFSEGVLFFVIILTGLIMLFGLQVSKQPISEETNF